MIIFLSYSHEDKMYADVLSVNLEKAGHEVWLDSTQLKVGDNILEKVNEGIQSADVLIVIVSQNSLKSKWVQHEWAAMEFGELSKGTNRIIPVLVDKSPLPNYLSKYFALDLTENFDFGIQNLIDSLREESAKKPREKQEPEIKEKHKRSYKNDIELEFLKNELSLGRLSLICGAGVSIEAGAPSWDKLLIHLLQVMMNKMPGSKQSSFSEANANEFKTRYGLSSLIMGKYLKNNLGDSFYDEVQKILYPSQQRNSAIIKSIVKLSMPPRQGKSLDSIVTFNFDAFIEEALDKSGIQFCSIYKEGIRNSASELPIYHVHGYLPKEGVVPEGMELVFSEDAYHSQFIEPFSWSNLIQLTKLSQNTCLFVGLSLSDPNLRRLLDVAYRKNPNSRNHYIIKRVPNNSSDSDNLDDLAFLLEEQDANEMGLNVIWVNEYKEISEIINHIAER